METSETPSSSKRPKLARVLLVNGLVLLALLLVVFAGGESYYRFWYDSTDSLGLTLVSKRWFERHYQLNNVRYRDNIDYVMEKPVEKRRITLLGDSFTAGHGVKNVEDRFGNILRRIRPNEEVYVFGTNGFDTGHDQKVLRQWFRKGYQTDVIVLVYMMNDISDLIPEWDQALKRLEREKEQEGFLVRNSYFINKVYYQIKAMRDPVVREYDALVKDAYTGVVWEQQKERLSDIIALCKERNIELLVVTFPFLHSIGGGYPYQEAHQKLDAFWTEKSVPHLDLLDIYKANKPEEVVVSKWDAHPNEFAHQKAAEAIDEFLKKELK